MAILTVERGEEEGKVYTILDRVFIARNPGADISLLDLKASRKHCVIFRKNEKYFIQDQGSRNGTSVNGKVIQKVFPLKEGDLIRIGLSWFRFQISEDQEMDLQKAFPHYKLMDQIGQGGMGLIYRAIHLPLERQVALKILPPKLVQENPKLRELFIREASVLTVLSHENICMLLDFNLVEPFIYFSMELVEGISLEDYISLHGGLEIRESLQIALQIAQGLGHAHRKGLIHRDMKPRNIMLNRQKDVKIVDFGLAKIMAEALEEEQGMADLGTLEYISPEQVGNKSLDERSDIYSLGITLYQMLAGATPFEGDTPYTMVHKHLNVKPPSLAKLKENLPREILSLVEKCLKKDPEDRYPDCEHLIRDLEKCLQLYDAEEEMMVEVNRIERSILSFFLLFQDPWFCWIFFPFVGLLMAALFQLFIG